MNIDIVNKQISKTLNLSEKKVALINKFYWRNIYDHLYDYNEQPLNIDHICVLYNDKYLLKKAIRLYIKKIRFTKVSRKFKPDSNVRLAHIENYKKVLRELWRLRKAHKFTN